MAGDDTLTRRINIWAQSAAILIAGGWAFYAFVLKEESKSQHIIPSVNVHVLEPSAHAPEGGKFTAIELGLTVENVSERDAYIIAAVVVSFGHRARDASADIVKRPPIDLRNVGAQLIMGALEWSGNGRDVAGELVTLPRFKLIRAEKLTHQYVLFVPSGEYDILETWAEFHVVDDCRYIRYIHRIDKCYEFAAKLGWESTNQRAQEALAVRLDLQKAFYYREAGTSSDWTPISEDELRSSYGYRNFQTTRMIVLPDAPILKVQKAPSPGVPR